jgi:hypothetical protein
MPEAEVVARQLLEQSLPQATTFFERAEKDLVLPPGIAFRALFASVPRRLGALADKTLEAQVELRAARRHWTPGFGC